MSVQRPVVSNINAILKKRCLKRIMAPYNRFDVQFRNKPSGVGQVFLGKNLMQQFEKSRFTERLRVFSG